MSRLESSAVAWRKSSACDSSACVEMAQMDSGVLVRDNTRPEVHLTVDGVSWHGLLHDIRIGRFDG